MPRMSVSRPTLSKKKTHASKNSDDIAKERERLAKVESAKSARRDSKKHDDHHHSHRKTDSSKTLSKSDSKKSPRVDKDSSVRTIERVTSNPTTQKEIQSSTQRHHHSSQTKEAKIHKPTAVTAPSTPRNDVQPKSPVVVDTPFDSTENVEVIFFFFFFSFFI